ncbi:MAG: hypothetical protein JO126_07020 [Alphaproteobacteria bacterium]|nr:hypothetical protein [Alphaproteobacteria bacterium]MBV8549191.1 hypothetical protein [Alphaproteobacteria bacterium]
MGHDVSRHSLLNVTILAAMVVFLGGLIWLAGSHIAPPKQKVEQTIPDERIPR